MWYSAVKGGPVGTAREVLLDRVMADVSANGIADRSLRDVATSIGSSHRMLLFHFGSREELVAAIVERVEAQERQTFRELAARHSRADALVRALWAHVSSVPMRPFVRLFFEAVVYRAGTGDTLTGPWLDDVESAAEVLGRTSDPVAIRLGVAVVRGLLIDVLATGDVGPATESLERFLSMWRPASQGRARRT